MSKTQEFFSKNGLIIVSILLLLVLLQQCNISGNLKSTKKEIVNLDSSLRKEIKIDGLRTCKRVLFDQNSVVRTVKRPDDLMNEYDKEIKKLEGE